MWGLPHFLLTTDSRSLQYIHQTVIYWLNRWGTREWRPWRKNALIRIQTLQGVDLNKRNRIRDNTKKETVNMEFSIPTIGIWWICCSRLVTNQDWSIHSMSGIVAYSQWQKFYSLIVWSFYLNLLCWEHLSVVLFHLALLTNVKPWRSSRMNALVCFQRHSRPLTAYFTWCYQQQQRKFGF